MLFLIFILSLGSVSTKLSYQSCWFGDSDCDDCDEGVWYEPRFTATIKLYNFRNMGFVNQMIKAQEIIKQQDPGNVIKFDKPKDYHTSFMYFCCYNHSEKEIIEKVLDDYKWKDIEVLYQYTWCNVDMHDNKTIYITAMPSNEDMEKLFRIEEEIANLIREKGIDYPKRAQDFHSTQARVTHSYPTDLVVSQLNETIVYGKAWLRKPKISLF